jgi:hypothetical protein
MTDPVGARLRDALSRPTGPSSDFDLNPGIRHFSDKPCAPPQSSCRSGCGPKARP